MQASSRGSIPLRSTKWKIVRQDDTGNAFVIETGLEKEVAENKRAEFEARGHKQMYWIEED